MSIYVRKTPKQVLARDKNDDEEEEKKLGGDAQE